MSTAKQELLTTFKLRSNGMAAVADNIDQAFAKEGAIEAQDTIAQQMKLFYASDQVYTGVVLPEVETVVDEQGISDFPTLPAPCTATSSSTSSPAARAAPGPRRHRRARPHLLLGHHVLVGHLEPVLDHLGHDRLFELVVVFVLGLFLFRLLVLGFRFDARRGLWGELPGIDQLDLRAGAGRGLARRVDGDRQAQQRERRVEHQRPDHRRARPLAGQHQDRRRAAHPRDPGDDPGGTPVLNVEVSNGGDSEESAINVTVNVGGATQVGTIPRIGPGETEVVKFTLTSLAGLGRADRDHGRGRVRPRRARRQQQQLDLHGHVPVRVAFLGPAGTFTEDALQGRGGRRAITEAPTATIYDAILAVEHGEAERALVPFENSIEGSVRATLDTLAFDAERGRRSSASTTSPIRAR